MTRPLLLPTLVALSMAACSPTPTSAEPSAPAAPAPPAAAAPLAATATAAANAPAPATPAAPVVAPSASSISGAIRDGNRAPPALRVCAQPLAGGAPTCIDTAAGADRYRLDVVAGRYVVTGQALAGPALAFAHAERIRCIRAPCPPDAALVVEVAPGEDKSGIDLSAGEALPPA